MWIVQLALGWQGLFANNRSMRASTMPWWIAVHSAPPVESLRTVACACACAHSPYTGAQAFGLGYVGGAVVADHPCTWAHPYGEWFGDGGTPNHSLACCSGTCDLQGGTVLSSQATVAFGSLSPLSGVCHGCRAAVTGDRYRATLCCATLVGVLSQSCLLVR